MKGKSGFKLCDKSNLQNIFLS